MSYYQQIVGTLSAEGETPSSRWDQWIWPLMKTEETTWPTRSDGFGVKKRGGKGHFGADIMFRRGGAGKHFVPEGAQAYLCAPGKVFSSEMTGTGWTVKVSHRVEGRPILSVYRHLKSSPVRAGQVLPTGTPLGPVGDNPASASDPPHVHFELWDTSLNNTALRDYYAAQVSKGVGDKHKSGEYLKWIMNPATVMGPWRVLLSDGSIVPHTGDPGDKGDPGEMPRGGGGSGSGGLVAFLALLGLGGLLTFGKSRKRRYV